MILTTLLIIAIVAIAFLKRDQIAPGSVALGFGVAFLLLGTVVGPHLQDGMAYVGGEVQSGIAAMWHDATN